MNSIPNGVALAQENGAAANLGAVNLVKPKPANRSRGHAYQAIPPPRKHKKPTAIPPPEKSAAKVEPPVSLDPTFLEHCQEALTYCIGPIAPMIIEEILANNPPSSPNQLIDSLAEEIPNPEAVREFHSRLRSSLES